MSTVLKSCLALTIGSFTILAKFYPTLISVLPLLGVVLSIFAMRKASKFQIFLATMAMAVCIVGIVVTFLPHSKV